MQSKIPSEIPETELLKNSPAYFIKAIFGYRIDEPHWNILQHYEQAQETLDLAPRGCGKTRIGNIGYCAFLAANNPDIRILIVSDTDTHAVRFLGTIKAVLESHPLIKTHYGDLKGDLWTAHELFLKTRTDKTLTEATISAMGMYSGAVTTGHYRVIIADDLINFDNSRTEGQRERSKEWFKTTLLPTLLPGGEIHCLGTRYHYNELWDCVMNELGYDTQIQCAILNEGLEDERSLWEWHMPLHTKIVNGRTIKGLTEIRDGGENSTGIGSVIFALQYQNDVELMKKGGQFFKRKWFEIVDAVPQGKQVRFWDMAATEDKGNDPDWTVGCLIAETSGIFYIKDIIRFRRAPADTEKIIKQAAQIDGITTKIYMEQEPGASGVIMIDHYARDILKGYAFMGIRSTGAKATRAQPLSAAAENGNVKLRNAEWINDMLSEAELFPNGAHDDIVDAMSGAFNEINQVNKPSIMQHPFSAIPITTAAYKRI